MLIDPYEEINQCLSAVEETLDVGNKPVYYAFMARAEKLIENYKKSIEETNLRGLNSRMSGLRKRAFKLGWDGDLVPEFTE